MASNSWTWLIGVGAVCGWVSQRPEFAARDGVGQGEGVAAKHVDVLEAERRQAGHVLWAHVEALGAELVQRRVHVDRVPEHDDVDHKAQGPELVLLALAVALAQFAALAVEHSTGKLMPALAAVELHQDAAPVCLVVDVGQQVEALDHAAPLLQGAGQPGRAVVSLQGADQPGGLHGAELERAGQDHGNDPGQNVIQGGVVSASQAAAIVNQLPSARL